MSAEAYATTESLEECEWIRNVLSEIFGCYCVDDESLRGRRSGTKLEALAAKQHRVVVFTDSWNVQASVQKNSGHVKDKRLRVVIAMLREAFMNKAVNATLEWIPTTHMAADGLTKRFTGKALVAVMGMLLAIMNGKDHSLPKTASTSTARVVAICDRRVPRVVSHRGSSRGARLAAAALQVTCVGGTQLVDPSNPVPWPTAATMMCTLLLILLARIAFRLLDQAIDMALARFAAYLFRGLAAFLRFTARGLDAVADFFSPRPEIIIIDPPCPSPAPASPPPASPATPPRPASVESEGDAQNGTPLRTPTPTPEDVRRPSLPEHLVGYGKYKCSSYAAVLRCDSKYCQWTINNDGPSKTPEFCLFSAFLRSRGFTRGGQPPPVRRLDYDLGAPR